MDLWEQLHRPFLAMAEACTDPVMRISAYRDAIAVDYACEIAHQHLSDTAHQLARAKRLAADGASVEEWQALAVAHYGDAVLEDVRRRCVRLSIGAASWGEWSVSEREGFRSLASELRGHATA